MKTKRLLPGLSLLCALLLMFTHRSSALEAPAWSDALVKLERWPATASSPSLSTAFAVSPGLLATILPSPQGADSFRAVTSAGIVPVRILARDDISGFTLLTSSSNTAGTWPVVPLTTPAGALSPGDSLTLQSGTPAPARLAGRELLHRSRLLECPWLRVHLPAGSWSHGTPLTTPDGSLAGILAGEVPDVTEAGRVLPLAAVCHFVKLWTERQTLARAVLGLKLSPAAGIPRVEECVAALPAERAGLQPGDVILRIGNQNIQDAAAAAEACFYLRVDEPVGVTVLRGTETVQLSMTPVSAAGSRPKLQ